jgi:hypothetical protein
MGVTHLVRVNPGRASARSAAQGRSRAEQLRFARGVVKGSSMRTNRHRAKFVAPASSRTRARRAAAYQSARRRGLEPNRAARSAVRRVPFTGAERRQGSVFQGVRARQRANPVRLGKPKTTAERAATYRQRRAERIESRGPRRVSEKQRAAARRNIKKAQAALRRKRGARRKARGSDYKRVVVKRRVPVTTTRTKTVSVKRRLRYKYGKYRRVRMRNPRSGRVEYSYMYRDKRGRLRRIPTSAIVGKSEKKAASVKKGRVRAARRIVKQGGAFVANRRRRSKSTKSRRRGKLSKAARSAAAKKGWRRRRRTGTTKRRQAPGRGASARAAHCQPEADQGGAQRRGSQGLAQAAPGRYGQAAPSGRPPSHRRQGSSSRRQPPVAQGQQGGPQCRSSQGLAQAPGPRLWHDAQSQTSTERGPEPPAARAGAEPESSTQPQASHEQQPPA